MMISGNELKRKLIQIAAFGFTNARIGGLASGKIYTGPWKNFCAPGLNCYSCPAATFACPIGAMQAVAGDRKYSISFYVLGFILALGVLFGRMICGFLCPFGLLQELLRKIPLPKLKLPAWMRYIKYAVLLIFVILLPIVNVDYTGTGKPAFCEFICPAGTLEGGLPLLATHPELRSALGALFWNKLVILILVLISCCTIYRCFCKVLCPLGAIYGLLNKISLYQLKIDKHQCIHCGRCADICEMDVDPVNNCRSAECIRCGKCAAACPKDAIKLGFDLKKTADKEDEPA